MNEILRLAAADFDVIKTYVRLGFGASIITETSYEPGIDSESCPPWTPTPGKFCTSFNRGD